jgi:4-amino-4-deoxy-L-arabinose transferase-like glycosyltransferase
LAATLRRFARCSGKINGAVTDLLSARATRWSVIGLAVVLFGLSNLPWQLDDYDQAKQAFTSFEMVECGHWFYQHTPNGWVATKPPLIGWISAALHAITGSWEAAWRLPSLFAAAGLLLLLMRSAAIYGAVASLVAACAFAFNMFTPRLASLVRTDMPLALVLCAIGFLIWRKVRERNPWTTKDRWILFSLLSAGMLIKGPIVYAFLLPGIVAMWWWSRRNCVANAAWSGWLPWLLSFLVFLIWVAGGILFVPEFTEHVVLREFAGRFSDEVHRPQPFYFYLPHLLHRFAPWSLLLIAGGFLALKNGERGWREFSPETFWLIVWSAGGLLVMSAIPSKRIDRIFPIVPPLCLLLAASVDRIWSGSQRSRKGTTVLAVATALAIVGISIYAVQKTARAYREHRNAFAVFGAAVVKEAKDHNWRYAVVGGDDEGLILYLRRTAFLEPWQGIAEWNTGRLDALVVPLDELPEMLPEMRSPIPKELLVSEAAGVYKRRYVLLAAPPQT